MTTTIDKPPQRSPQAWYRPMFSPDHGVYVVVVVSFLVGAAAAQAWTWQTTLALLCALAGFQAEHPLRLQIKQRKSWKPRFLVWGGVYGGIALVLAGLLYWQQGGGFSPLLIIYGVAGLALGGDAIAVFHRQQKSILNELITFAAVCLSAPLAYVATTGAATLSLIGLWALCTLYFASTIFTVKLRKLRQGEDLGKVLGRAGAYHGIATLLVALLYGIGLLPLIPALALGVVIAKFALITLCLPWYRTTRIGQVAALETSAALLFGAIVMVSLLPARWP